MKQNNTYKILVWIIVILVATNLSTIGSFYYHRISESKTVAPKDDSTSIPGEQRTRFFRDELNLTTEQLEQFRDMNRNFNRTARNIEMNLVELRKNMIDELGSTNPDNTKLDQLATEIGDNHRELKQLTNTFYLNMKKICTSEQQVKLYQIFQSMLNKESQINLPRQGNQGGRWRNK